MRRLIAFSLAFTGLALAIVLGAIGYRVSRAGGSTPEAEIGLPRGAKLTGTAIGDGLLALTIEADGASEVRLFDAGTLKPRGRLRLRPEP